MRKGDDLTTFIVPKIMENPEALTFRIPKGLFRPVAGKLCLYLFYGCSQLFKLFHSFKRFITYLYVPILSCVLLSTHDHIVSFLSIYF
jgi:hypothetical protein